MSLDPPTYLASLQSNIRQRPIAWDGAVRAGTLTENQLAKIRAIDKAKRDVRKKTVEADLDGYRILFAGEAGNPSVLESASQRQDVVQYSLVLLNDLLDSRLPPYLAGRGISHQMLRRLCCPLRAKGAISTTKVLSLPIASSQLFQHYPKRS